MSIESMGCCEAGLSEKYFRIRAHHLGDFWILYNLAKSTGDKQNAAFKEATTLFQYNLRDVESYYQEYQEFLGLKDLTPDELDLVLSNNDFSRVDMLGSPENAQEFVGKQTRVNLRFLTLGDSDLVAINHGPDEICDSLTGPGTHCTEPDNRQISDYSYDLIMMYAIIKYYTDHLSHFSHRDKPKIIGVFEEDRPSFAIELSAGLLFDIFNHVSNEQSQYSSFGNIIAPDTYESCDGVPPRDFELHRRKVWVRCINLLLAI